MNVTRLLHLITVLERVERERLGFNMGIWHASTDQHSCGTTCCAGGWAALDPVFNAEGLALEHYAGGISTPAFGDRTHYGAIQEFFGLEVESAVFLFNPNTYSLLNRDIRPHHVIANIRELLASQKES